MHDTICSRCGKLIPEGEKFVDVYVNNEICEGNVIMVQGHGISVFNFCLDCAEKKDFENLHVPDRVFQGPNQEFHCCICGEKIPEGTPM